MKVRVTPWCKFWILAICLVLLLLYGFSSFLKLKGDWPTSCKWPPSNRRDIEVDGMYNIMLCVQVERTQASTDQPKKYLLSDLFSAPTNNTKVTFYALSQLPNIMWKNMKFPNICRTYPQDVDMGLIVQNIKSGKPVNVAPMYNSPIRILKTSKSVCANGKRHDLIVVVKNAVYNAEARKEFRAFMNRQAVLFPSFRVGYVFSVGLPRKHGGRYFNRSGHLMNLTSPGGDILQNYDGRGLDVVTQINDEIAKYDDILLADYEDTYYNLTWKTITNLRWMSGFCDKNYNDFFMTIDDDHRMNLSMIQAFKLSTEKKHLRTAIYGYIAGKDEASRSPASKMYLSPVEVPWPYMCPYPRGFSQFFGADIVDDMAIAAAYTKHNYMHEDVYLGLVAFKLGISQRHLSTTFDHGGYEFLNKAKRPAMVAMTRYMQTK